MSRAGSRIVTNAEKIRALAQGSYDDQHPRTPSRAPSRQEHHVAQRAPSRQEQQERHDPTDILSDGYDSGGDRGSEQVLALLRRQEVIRRESEGAGNIESWSLKYSQEQAAHLLLKPEIFRN